MNEMVDILPARIRNKAKTLPCQGLHNNEQSKANHGHAPIPILSLCAPETIGKGLLPGKSPAHRLRDEQLPRHEAYLRFLSEKEGHMQLQQIKSTMKHQQGAHNAILQPEHDTSGLKSMRG